MKIQKVQNFDEFTFKKIDEANDSFFSFDFLGNLFTEGFGAFSDVLKGKVIAYLMEYLGIAENTIFSKLVQNFVEQIEVKDYYGILFGDKKKASYFAPKAAEATIEFLTEKGVDGIAKDLGVTDTNGYLYRTISEMMTNQTKKAEFTKTLENFYLSLFGGLPQSSMDDFKKSLKPAEKAKLENDLIAKAKTKGIEVKKPEEKNMMVNTFFDNLGSLNQANPAQISNTAGEDLFLNLIQPKK